MSMSKEYYVLNIGNYEICEQQTTLELAKASAKSYAEENEGEIYIVAESVGEYSTQEPQANWTEHMATPSKTRVKKK